MEGNVGKLEGGKFGSWPGTVEANAELLGAPNPAGAAGNGLGGNGKLGEVLGSAAGLDARPAIGAAPGNIGLPVEGVAPGIWGVDAFAYPDGAV